MEQEIIHTFLVLAYKESPYLENAVKSVLNQEYPSKVVIGTSTDNEYIRSIADKYHLDVIVINRLLSVQPTFIPSASAIKRIGIIVEPFCISGG